MQTWIYYLQYPKDARYLKLLVSRLVLSSDRKASFISLHLHKVSLILCLDTVHQMLITHTSPCIPFKSSWLLFDLWSLSLYVCDHLLRTTHGIRNARLVRKALLYFFTLLMSFLCVLVFFCFFSRSIIVEVAFNASCWWHSFPSVYRLMTELLFFCFVF